MTAKTLAMLIALGGVLAAGTACFGLFTRSDPPAAEACAGLSGDALADCERRHREP